MCTIVFNEKIKWQKSDSMVPGSINFNLVNINIEQMLYNSGKTTFDSRKNVWNWVKYNHLVPNSGCIIPQIQNRLYV